jgi:hypothetical protein
MHGAHDVSLAIVLRLCEAAFDFDGLRRVEQRA